MIVERTAMKPQLFAPFVTYPQASDPAIAVKAVMIAAELHGDLHAVAFNADIPDISNVWSNLLLDLPDMIGKAEEDSRQHGEQLLRKVVEAAEKNKVTITTERHKGAIALLGGLAAEQARYFDLVILGWENGNPTSRATAEAVLFGSGRPTLIDPTPIRTERISARGSRLGRQRRCCPSCSVRNASPSASFPNSCFDRD